MFEADARLQQGGETEGPATALLEGALPEGAPVDATSDAAASTDRNLFDISAAPGPSAESASTQSDLPRTSSAAAPTTPEDASPAGPCSPAASPSEPLPTESDVPAEIAGREWVEVDGVMVEAGNAVWDERDWSGVPVRAWSDEPPAGWVEQLEAEWAAQPSHPELGPIAWLEEVPASGYLMNELEHLPVGLVQNDYDALELVAHWSRLASYAAAKMREAVAELANSEGLDQGLANLDHLGIRVNQPSIASDDIALRLGMGKRAASRLVRSARMLAGPAGPTAEALETGQIDPAKADIIALGIEDLGMLEALQVQDIVLAKAPHATATAVRRDVAAARASVQPERFEDRCQRAATQRRVDRPRVLPDGMASIYAFMPAVEANQLYRALDAAARSAKTSGDPRTLDQLRADALALMGGTAIVTGIIGPCPHPTHDATPQAHDATVVARGAGGGSAGGSSGDRDPGSGHGDIDQSGSPPTATGVAELPDPRVTHDDRSRAGIDPAAGTTQDAAARPTAGTTQDAAARSAAGAATGACPTPGQSMRVGVIGGKSAHVRVVIPLTTLMGGQTGPGADLPGSEDPAHLEGYGPIPASVARALAAGGPWARMVTDPLDRTILELSREQYEPTPAMAELIRARQPECANPSCTAAADGCDLHHRIPWPLGTTSVKDIDPNCRRDHLLLTHGGWWYTQHDDGSRTWITATNHTYLQHPDGQITMIRPTHGPGSPPEGTDPATPAWASITDRTSALQYTVDDEPPPF
ncbi:DUF222 domain-containing protein [Pseudactinotalea terrae]|uniref:DUF222 domain-containing protein n=1 Tax=Pseudactinotalea terrae TaxID=1743262 RepID=UPI0012E1C2CC|nr:DUF222 domain-containing protein [Pseudactinotalea terrae]